MVDVALYNVAAGVVWMLSELYDIGLSPSKVRVLLPLYLKYHTIFPSRLVVSFADNFVRLLVAAGDDDIDRSIEGMVPLLGRHTSMLDLFTEELEAVLVTLAVSDYLPAPYTIDFADIQFISVHIGIITAPGYRFGSGRPFERLRPKDDPVREVIENV